MKVTLTIPLAILCLLLAAVRPANATWVTIQIEGVVDYVEDSANYLEGKINIGDPITGYYIYDTATPDSSPYDPVQGNYWHYSGPAGVFLSVGGLEFGTNPADVEFHMALRNNITGSNEDIYAFVSYNNLPIEGYTPVQYVSWQLNDLSGTALNSDALILEPPDLGQWQTNILRLEGDRTFLVQGHVTSAVPEPTALLVIALGAMGLVRGRTHKNYSPFHNLKKPRFQY